MMKGRRQNVERELERAQTVELGQLEVGDDEPGTELIQRREELRAGSTRRNLHEPRALRTSRSLSSVQKTGADLDAFFAASDYSREYLCASQKWLQNEDLITLLALASQTLGRNHLALSRPGGT